MSDSHTDDPRDPSEPAAPPRLVEDLAALFAGGPAVPEATDEAIGSLAREHLERAERRKVVRLWGSAVAAAAAAVIAVGVWLAGPFGSPERVTILHAFRLARRLDDGVIVDAHWDVTGDGIVDGRDVEALAREAVRLR